MKAHIIKIGNSKGLRFPKVILDQCGFGNTVELRIEGHRLIIEAVSDTRAGWDEAFESMASLQDDAPLLNENADTHFEQDEWTW